MQTGRSCQRIEQQVKALARMEAAQGEAQWAGSLIGPYGAAGLGPGPFLRTAHIRNEIWQIMDPLAGPAMRHGVIDNGPRVADQMIAAPVMLQIVVSAEPRHVREAAARTESRRPAHPGHYDIGPERGDFTAERASAGKIE